LTTEETQIQENGEIRTPNDSDRYDLMQWRREQALRLRTRGYAIDKIADEKLQIGHGTISGELKAIRAETNVNLSKWVTEELPTLNKSSLAGISEIIKSAWEPLADSTKEERTRIAALQLVRDAYITQRDFLSDTNILNKTLHWIEWAKKEELQMDIQRIERDMCRRAMHLAVPTIGKGCKE
jgi:hypothetical protein